MITVLFAQGNFALLRLFLDVYDGVAVVPQIFSVFFAEALEQEVHELFVKVLAAQLVVAAGRLHFQNALKHLQQRHVKRSAAKVIHQHMAFFLHVFQSVAQRRRRRLIQNALHRQPGHLPGGDRLPALYLVKIRGNGNYGPVHVLAQIFRRVIAHIGQQTRLQLNGGILALAKGDALARAGLPLDLYGGIFRGKQVLRSGPLPDNPVAAGVNADDRRRNHDAVRIGDHFLLTVPVNRRFCGGCA